MNKAREQKEAFDLVLIRFALERLLYRLSQSNHGHRFVLKGAMLFQIWSGEGHRPTRDLDLLGTGTPSPTEFERLFRDVCGQPVEDDGLVFLADTVQAWDPDTRTGTGFPFVEYSSHALAGTMDWVLRNWRDQRGWKKLIENGMRQDFSWDRQGPEYVKLYRSILPSR